MRVKSEFKNKDKKKSTQSARSARSAQSARSAVCSLQSAWSAFWGDRNDMALTICTSISRNCFQVIRDWKLESSANGRKVPLFRSERKKRSTSEGTPQFLNGISGKLPYHLTSNRNFRIFSANGKHPVSPSNFRPEFTPQ